MLKIVHRSLPAIKRQMGMVMQINKSSFDEWSGSEDYSKIYLSTDEVVILLKYYNQIANKKVLDIGCGAGRTSFFLMELTDQYIGVDYSEEMVEICKQKYGNHFMVCDARNLEQFEDDSMDFIIFSFNGIDYVNMEGRIQALREIFRVLKSGGCFFFSSHNYNLYLHRGGGAPRLKVSLNPHRMYQNLKEYLLLKNNVRENKRLEEFGKDHAIINDSAHRYSMLTCYVKPEFQVKQLEEIGFTVLELYGTGGNLLCQTYTTCKDQFVNFLVRK
ncbi:MAG: methyltransferase domain-containing protein [Magnetococcales bacterium]|nr:methyltransferase domain-containing protein [Magnetococcales bacterium]